jgi:hypothetical protein
MVERDWYWVGGETSQGLLAMTVSSSNHLKISWDKNDVFWYKVIHI